MYKVGYIDDSAKTFTNYTYGLLEYDIELICTNEKMSKVQLVNWVLDNQIEAVMIDYKLNPKFEFVGTELIAYLNDKLPGLQCVVLTSYKSNSLEEKLVPKVLTYDRDIFSELDWTEIADTLKEYCQIFRNRMHFRKINMKIYITKLKQKMLTLKKMRNF